MLSLESLASYIGYPNIVYLWIYLMVTPSYHQENDLPGNQYICWMLILIVNIFSNISILLIVNKFIIIQWFAFTLLFLIFRLVNMLYYGESLGSPFFVMGIIANVYLCISLFLMGKAYLNWNKQWKLSNEYVEDHTTNLLKPHKWLNTLGLNWVKTTGLELAPISTPTMRPTVITTTNLCTGNTLKNTTFNMI